MRGHTSSPRLSRLLPWSLLALLALVAPWMLGGRSPQAYAILGLLAWGSVLSAFVGVLMEYWDWRHFAEYEQRRGSGRASPLRTFVVGLLRAWPLWLFLVMLFWSVLNPAYERTETALVGRAFNPDWPLVVDPARSLPGIWFLGGLIAAVAVLTNPACRPRAGWIRSILAILLCNAVILVITGLLFRFSGSELILGRYAPRADYFFATFYYKNHWAAFALLYAGVAGFFFFQDLPRWFGNARRAGSGGLALVSLLFLGLSFPVVDSRSGILLFVAWLVLFAGTLYQRLRSSRARAWLMGASVAGIAALAWLSVADLRSNWLRTETQMDRAGSVVFDSIRAHHGPEVCLSMLADRPLLGWGYLSFDPLFTVYAGDFFRDDAGQLRTDMEFAHNDWLQHAAEFGILGSFLLLAGLIKNPHPKPNRDHGRDRHPHRDQIPVRFIRYAILLLGVFALWDFPFSNPAVLANAVILGIMARSLR